MRTSDDARRGPGPTGQRGLQLAWAVCLASLLALYLGCSDKPPAGKVTEAGQNGGNNTGNGGTSTAGTNPVGGTGTGATSMGGSLQGGGGGTSGTNPGGASVGGNAGAGNVGTGGGGGMVVEDDPSCRMGFPPQEDAAFQRYRILNDNQSDAMTKLAAMQPAEKLDILSGGPNCSYKWDPLESTCRHASLSIL